MEFFDRLMTGGVVKETGRWVTCLPRQIIACVIDAKTNHFQRNSCALSAYKDTCIHFSNIRRSITKCPDEFVEVRDSRLGATSSAQLSNSYSISVFFSYSFHPLAGPGHERRASQSRCIRGLRQLRALFSCGSVRVLPRRQFRALTAARRQEFIFRVLKHLTIGGGMCQVACTHRRLPTYGYSKFLIIVRCSLTTSGNLTPTQCLPCKLRCC